MGASPEEKKKERIKYLKQQIEFKKNAIKNFESVMRSVSKPENYRHEYNQAKAQLKKMQEELESLRYDD
ncbi:MAG: hypothetical protein ACI31F_07270 [Muribaculaceae bacterium]